jgi:hypothetical protein
MMLDIDEEHLSQEEEKSPHHTDQPLFTRKLIEENLLTGDQDEELNSS